MGTGHFTQGRQAVHSVEGPQLTSLVVWKGTTGIGCATRKCSVGHCHAYTNTILTSITGRRHVHCLRLQPSCESPGVYNAKIVPTDWWQGNMAGAFTDNVLPKGS